MEGLRDLRVDAMSRIKEVAKLGIDITTPIPEILYGSDLVGGGFHDGEGVAADDPYEIVSLPKRVTGPHVQTGIPAMSSQDGGPPPHVTLGEASKDSFVPAISKQEGQLGHEQGRHPYF